MSIPNGVCRDCHLMTTKQIGGTKGGFEPRYYCNGYYFQPRVKDINKQPCFCPKVVEEEYRKGELYE